MEVQAMALLMEAAVIAMAATKLMNFLFFTNKSFLFKLS
jgi:hypothetical protein